MKKSLNFALLDLKNPVFEDKFQMPFEDKRSITPQKFTKRKFAGLSASVAPKTPSNFKSRHKSCIDFVKDLDDNKSQESNLS